MIYLKKYEKFDFKDEDFDEEEFDDSKDEDLVDAMVKITIDDFNDGTLDPYFELLGLVNIKILHNFLWQWNWDNRKELEIWDSVLELTENLIYNGNIQGLKTFFRKIVKKHRIVCIGYLPEEIWDRFE